MDMHAMNRARIGIFGASGYAGMELTRLCAGHGQLELVFLASERHVGQPVEALTGVSSAAPAAYVDFATARAAAETCTVVFLATPAEVSLKVGSELIAAGVRVVDLSGAFRLQDAAAYQQFYAHAPASAELMEKAVYGLPELFREQIASAQLLSNPGCYATAATLALYPLLARKLIRSEDLVISALSGASGAGRKAAEDFSLVELHDNVKAYRVLNHQHIPEIEQSLSRATGARVSLTFTPHLLPIPRGILSTAYARLTSARDAKALTAELRAAYAGEPFIRVLDRPEDVTLHGVVGTNLCHLGVTCHPEDGGRVVVVSAIDNLVKGAAGQALQNLNLMLGQPQQTGLASLRRFHP